MSTQQLTPFGSALAGALGAIFSNAAVYPLDTVKTRLQALPPDERPSADLSPSDKEVSLPTEVHRAAKKRDVRGLPRSLLRRLRRWEMLSMLLRIVKTEGLSGVFKGFSANMINTFSQQFAYFFFHTSLRSALLSRLPLPTLSTAQELALGALAGALAQIFTIPVSVIALRQQISSSKSTKSLLDVGREIVSESGWTGLWTGLKPGLVLTVNPAITYGVFERVKAIVLARHAAAASAAAGGGVGGGTAGPGRLTLGESFWIGVASKTLATVVTYPYIFAKVRLQAQSRAKTPPKTSGAVASASAPAPAPTAGAAHTSEPGSYAEIASHPPAADAPVVAESEPTAPAPRDAPTPASASAKSGGGEGAIALLLRVYKARGLAGWYQGLGAQIIKAVLCQGILFVSKDQLESYTILLLALLGRLRARLNIAR